MFVKEREFFPLLSYRKENANKIYKVMNMEFLPQHIARALNNIDTDKLYELRLRRDFPIVLNYGGKNVFLTPAGASFSADDAIASNAGEIEEIVYAASEYSVYANDEKIRSGYLTAQNGVRIGLAGECVWESGRITTIKNISSLNIRIPHNVIGCSDRLFAQLKERNAYNMLVVSPPGMGKTTILKDIVRNLAETRKNVLLIDERGELAAGLSNPFCDVVKYGSKLYAFSCALRSLAPQIVVTDELSTEEDFRFVSAAVDCGIDVVASMHGRSLAAAKLRLKEKAGLYVLLDGAVGKIRETVC